MPRGPPGSANDDTLTSAPAVGLPTTIARCAARNPESLHPLRWAGTQCGGRDRMADGCVIQPALLRRPWPEPAISIHQQRANRSFSFGDANFGCVVVNGAACS